MAHFTQIRVLSLLAGAASFLAVSIFPYQAQAQSVRAGGSTDTDIIREGDRYIIRGRTLSNDEINLFHDLERFGLSAGEIAEFFAQPGVENILTRVSGGEVSLINGLIEVSGSDANLFLMNPAGIIFGTEAVVNAPADFTATTATGIGFESGWFSAIGDNDYASLVGTPNRFAFGVTNPGIIINAGELVSGNDLALLGGTVIHTGTITAPSDIVIAAVPGENLVRISQPGNLLSLEIEPFSDTSLPNEWSLPIAVLPQLLTGGEIGNATELTLNEQGELVLNGSGVAVEVEDGSTIISNSVRAANLEVGESGGTVQILGTYISLIDAEIDVSGSANGGTALIGGDVQQPTRVPYANTIWFDEVFIINGNSIGLERSYVPNWNVIISMPYSSTVPYRSTVSGTVSATGILSVPPYNPSVPTAIGSTEPSATSPSMGSTISSGTSSTVSDNGILSAPPYNPSVPTAIDSTEPSATSPSSGAVSGTGTGSDNGILSVPPYNPSVPTAIGSTELSSPVIPSLLPPNSVPYFISDNSSNIQFSHAQNKFIQTTTVFDGCHSQYLNVLSEQRSILIENLSSSTSESLDLAYRMTLLGNTCFHSGYYPQAHEIYEAALELAKATDDVTLQSILLGSLGNVSRIANSNYIQAIEYYQQQHTLVQTSENTMLATAATINLGNVYFQLSEYDVAVQLFQKAFNEAQSLDERSLVASALTNLGVISLSLGNSAAATTYQQQALEEFRHLGDRQGEATALVNLGISSFAQGQFSRAFEQYEQGLTIAQTMENQSVEASIFGNIGITYQQLGQFEQATDFHQKQLDLARTLGDRQQEANALGNLGATYNLIERYQEAIEWLEKQLFIAQDIGDRAGEANALNNLGESYRELGQIQQAVDMYTQAGDIFRSIGNRQAEAIVIGNLGLIQATQNQPAEAMEYHQQALALKREVGDREGERTTLSEIGDLLATQGHVELAIIFYKQSINISKAIRQDLQALPIEIQQSYANEVVADTYRALADLLLQQDRVIEAQQVLDLLKVQELDDYLQNVRGNDSISGLDYYEPEQRILDLYDQAIALGRELEHLRSINPSDLTPQQQQRIAELVSLEQEIVISFYDFIDRPDIQAQISQLSRTARRQNLDLDQLNALQDNLRNLNQNAVLLYPLVLDDRLELILVTSYSPPIRRTVPVRREDLNRAIVSMRRELYDPDNDIFTASQQLYEWLIAPLEADLAAAGAETIVYAPDQQLRYVPLSALSDGNQWLAERFRVNHITAASLTDFDTAPRTEATVLAAAFSDPGETYEFQIGQRQFSYEGLPYAGEEVKRIAEEVPNTISLFNENFSSAQVLPQMNHHSIVHFATHAAFVPGTPEESFILFGNGDRATLRDVATWSLQNVDLVVLSACQTGIGGELGTGEEILGFGYQLQRTGARAALASLWSVDDGGTQQLMNLFYNALNDSELSKAEALRQAQIAMITGDASDFSLAPATLDAIRTDYQHPYYWSSFILIGNGL
ncbi:MAG: CHAT domain-containing protein [Elainellaceae cyanobacterium]